MKQKKKAVQKKRKLRIGRILLALFLFAIFSLAIFCLFKIPITNVLIQNNKYLNDQQIIDQVFPNGYPNFFSTTKSSVQKKIKQSFPIVKDVKIKRGFFDTLYIDIIEHQILFAYQGNYVFEDGTSMKIGDQNYFAPPLLIRNGATLEDDLYQKFIKNLSEIDSDILDKISEISYSPNGQKDIGRFILLMSDGNYVYTTVTKLNKLNMYDDVKKISNGKRGILSLDSLRDEDQGMSFKFIE